MYSKEELSELIIKNPEEYNSYKKTVGEIDLTELDFSNITLEELDSHIANCNFSGADLNAADFTRASVVECDFSESILNGTDFSYAGVNYCNFTDADMAGCIVKEADLSDSDFTASQNLSATRADETTVWPDNDMLPDDFDTNYDKENSEEEDDPVVSDY